MNAEHVYLFRHAVLRDAAYQLQLPSARARLHSLVIEVCEMLFGEPPHIEADLLPLSAQLRHRIDAFASDLAEHAALTESLAPGSDPRASKRIAGYRWRAALQAERDFMLNDALQHWLRLAETADVRLRAIALARAGSTACKCGKPVEAVDLLRRATECSPGDLRGDCLCSLGDALQDSGKNNDAELAYRGAGEAFMSAGNDEQTAAALSGLATVFMVTGRIDDAEKTSLAALAAYREAEDRRGEAVVLGNLGLVFVNTKRLDSAEECFKSSLDIYQALGELRNEGVALGYLGSLYYELGNLGKAMDYQERALAIHRRIGNRRFEGITLANISFANHRLGRIDIAEQQLIAALGLLREAGDRRYELASIASLAAIRQDQGRIPEAIGLLESCLPEIADSGDAHSEGAYRCLFARCLLFSGRRADADSEWRRGVRKLRAIGASGEVERQERAMIECCRKAGESPLGDPAS